MLPTQLGLLTRLQLLDLSGNSFTSSIPTSLCNLSKSIDLFLGHNPGITCMPRCLRVLQLQLRDSDLPFSVCGTGENQTEWKAPAQANSNDKGNDKDKDKDIAVGVGAGVVGLVIVFLCAAGIYKRRGWLLFRGGSSSLAAQDHQHHDHDHDHEQGREQGSEQGSKQGDV